MKYSEFRFYSRDYIRFEKLTYERTKSGKSWMSKPVSAQVKTVDSTFYERYIQSIPFFNHFGGRAYCRAQWNYTRKGYLPTVVTSVSPDGQTKIVAKFEF